MQKVVQKENEKGTRKKRRFS